MDAKLVLVGLIALAASAARAEEGELPPAPWAPEAAPPPAWLAPVGGKPLEPVKPGGIAAAFELAGLERVAPLKPRPPGMVVVTDSGVKPALATSPVLSAETTRLLASIEKLAEEATSIGDLSDVIEQCRAPSQPQSSKTYRLRRGELSRVASWAFNRRGEMHAAGGDDRTAYDDFQQAITLDATNAAALHNRALTLAQYGRREAAVADFARAATLEPESAAILSNRGQLLLAMGRAAEAERDFTAAIELEPLSAELFVGRAATRRLLGRTSAAVRDLNRAVTLDPVHAGAFAERGRLYAQQGFHEQAVADYDAALAADPRCVPAYQALAWLLSTSKEAALRDPDKALESARRALRLGDASDPMLLDAVAAAHAAAGLRDEAVRLQQQAILVAPEPLKAAFEHRLALYRAGKRYTAE